MPVETAHGQSDYFISGRRHFFHFHAIFRTDKKEYRHQGNAALFRRQWKAREKYAPPVPPPLINTLGFSFMSFPILFKLLLCRVGRTHHLRQSFFSLFISFATFVCTAERLTLNITPNAKHVIQIDVPPFDMSGSGCPETGNTPVVMAMWK